MQIHLIGEKLNCKQCQRGFLLKNNYLGKCFLMFSQKHTKLLQKGAIGHPRHQNCENIRNISRCIQCVLHYQTNMRLQGPKVGWFDLDMMYVCVQLTRCRLLVLNPDCQLDKIKIT